MKSRAQRKAEAARAKMIDANQRSQPLSKQTKLDMEQAKIKYVADLDALVHRMGNDPVSAFQLRPHEHMIVMGALLREQKFWGTHGRS